MTIERCSRCGQKLDHTVPSVTLEGWVPQQGRKVPLLAWCDPCWALISHVVLRQGGTEWAG